MYQKTSERRFFLKCLGSSEEKSKKKGFPKDFEQRLLH
jgi:hypothetical protein